MQYLPAVQVRTLNCHPFRDTLAKLFWCTTILKRATPPYWSHIVAPSMVWSFVSVHCLCIYHQSWLKYYVQDAMVPNVRKPKFCSLALQHCTLIWKHVCSLRVQFVVALLNLYKGTWVWAFSLFCGHIQRKKITVSKVAGILHITSPVNITSRKKIGKYFQMLMYNEKNQVFTKLIQVAS